VRDIGYKHGGFSLLILGSDSLTVTLVQVVGCNVPLAYHFIQKQYLALAQNEKTLTINLVMIVGLYLLSRRGFE